MATSRKASLPDRSPQAASPIQYITENGFSIIRLAEIDRTVTDTPRECHFLVRDERGREREIVVSFHDRLIARVQMERRARLSERSAFWIVCAESCLATYLWEMDAYPPDGRLNVTELSLDQSLLAKHWKDQQSDSAFE